MKYNPVNHTITRNDGTPYLHLAPGIGAPEAYVIADTLLQAPEWEKEKEELEEKIDTLEDNLKEEQRAAEAAITERDSAKGRAESLEDDLEETRVDLTQARLRIEELEVMLEACETENARWKQAYGNQ